LLHAGRSSINTHLGLAVQFVKQLAQSSEVN
jgi:hypothetical protein